MSLCFTDRVLSLSGGPSLFTGVLDKTGILSEAEEKTIGESGQNGEEPPLVGLERVSTVNGGNGESFVGMRARSTTL